MVGGIVRLSPERKNPFGLLVLQKQTNPCYPGDWVSFRDQLVSAHLSDCRHALRVGKDEPWCCDSVCGSTGRQVHGWNLCRAMAGIQRARNNLTSNHHENSIHADNSFKRPRLSGLTLPTLIPASALGELANRRRANASAWALSESAAWAAETWKTAPSTRMSS